MEDLEALLVQVRSCRLCEQTLPLGPRPVVQVAGDARILIVGQAPGRRVHNSGVPFDDPSGDRLRTWLGVTATPFTMRPDRAAAMGFCFPGTGKGGDLPPPPICAETWRIRLLAQLPNVQLTLVLGAYAQAWHLPDHRRQPLSATVARWREFAPEVLPAPHPSPRNMRWFRNHPWFEAEVVPYLQERVSSLLPPGQQRTQDGEQHG